MRIAHFGTILATLILCQARGAHAGKPLLELRIGDRAYTGRSVARDDTACWIEAQDGRLSCLSLQEITAFRKAAPEFRALGVMEVRDQLARELGRDYEVAAAGQYVVAAPPGRARPCAVLLDQVHRQFTTFFSRRNFGLTQPEFPLIALILPNADAFSAYCRADGLPYAPGLMGYYNPESNRIALYEGRRALSVVEPLPEQPLWRDARRAAPLAAVTAPWTIEADFRDTLVHEATHQLAFNMGLHTRIGENPRWVVEGLAMIFERDTGGSERYGSEGRRINPERHQWFMQRARQRLVPVKEFVAADRPFGAATLDAYSQAWALTFYLSERRSADFATYLKMIRERDVLADYTADQRVADFQNCFGRDLDWLQVEWLRFMDQL